MEDLKKSIEILFEAGEWTYLEIISRLQTGAAVVSDEELLDLLCELKWEHI